MILHDKEKENKAKYSINEMSPIQKIRQDWSTCYTNSELLEKEKPQAEHIFISELVNVTLINWKHGFVQQQFS